MHFINVNQWIITDDLGLKFSPSIRSVGRDFEWIMQIMNNFDKVSGDTSENLIRFVTITPLILLLTELILGKIKVPFNQILISVVTQIVYVLQTA